MNKRRVTIALLGLVIICFFITPIRFEFDSYRIRNGSIFDSGFIDFGRFFLYVIGWLIAVFASQFADFGFLEGDKAILFYKRLGSRVIDFLLILLASSIFAALFFVLDKSLFLLKIALPIVFLFLWLAYFVLGFKHGRTIGDKVFDLVQVEDDYTLIKRNRLLIRELIFVSPIFLFAMISGVIGTYASGYAAENDTEVTVLGVIFWLLFIVIDIVFPLAMFFNKHRQGVVDIITKTLVRSQSGT